MSTSTKCTVSDHYQQVENFLMNPTFTSKGGFRIMLNGIRIYKVIPISSFCLWLSTPLSYHVVSNDFSLYFWTNVTHIVIEVSCTPLHFTNSSIQVFESLEKNVELVNFKGSQSESKRHQNLNTIYFAWVVVGWIHFSLLLACNVRNTVNRLLL